MARPHLWDRSKERYWRRLVAHWRRSGQTIRAFCLREQISEPSFYAWRRTLAEREQEAAKNGARRSRRPAVGATRPSFVPVRVVADSAWRGEGIDVVLGNGRMLRVGSGFDAATLRQLLAVLEGGSC